MNEKGEEEKKRMVAEKDGRGVTLRVSDKTLLFDSLQWPLDSRAREREREREREKL